MKNKPDINSLETIRETDAYALVYDPECDPFAVVDGVPNYFIMNKQTDKVEFASNRLEFMSFTMDEMQTKLDSSEIHEPIPALSH